MERGGLPFDDSYITNVYTRVHGHAPTPCAKTLLVLHKLQICGVLFADVHNDKCKANHFQVARGVFREVTAAAWTYVPTSTTAEP